MRGREVDIYDRAISIVPRVGCPALHGPAISVFAAISAMRSLWLDPPMLAATRLLQDMGKTTMIPGQLVIFLTFCKAIET